MVFVFFFVTVFVYGLVSRRLSGSLVSGPMVFVAAGLIFATALGVPRSGLDSRTILIVGELALALTLFSDAARMNLAALKGNDLPVRMLVLGLPLTIAIGTAIASVFFANLSIWEAAILGTVLAPTDAGLGKQVVGSPKLPLRIRQTLNVEAGLNDGIAVPFLLIFITLAEVEGGVGAADIWATFAAEIGFGVLVGIIIGIVGGRLLKRALSLDWITQTYRSLVFPALAIISFVAADQLGGSGFIAAFVGGLTIVLLFGRVDEGLTDFIESEGQLVNLAVFFVFGAVVLSLLDRLDLLSVLYAALSLTVIRMVPVALSLIGKHLNRSTVLFLGWFGPRGLASIVLGLIVVEEIPQRAGLERIQVVVAMKVLLSVFANGISTNPLIDRPARRTKAFDVDAGEHQEAHEAPIRKTS